MKVNLIALACSVLLAVGFSVSSFAGSNVDTDSDGVPDGWDNCIEIANNQCDTDMDGYGNRCDCDFDQDGVGGVGDFGQFLANFGKQCSDGTYDEIYDMDCDCVVGVGDFGFFLACFGETGYPTNISSGKVATVGNPISGLPCAAAVYPPGAINCKEDF